LYLVCCQVMVSASGWSLVRRSLTGCGVSECNREVSVLRRPWFTRGCYTMEKESKKLFLSPGSVILGLSMRN